MFCFKDAVGSNYFFTLVVASSAALNFANVQLKMEVNIEEWDFFFFESVSVYGQG